MELSEKKVILSKRQIKCSMKTMVMQRILHVIDRYCIYLQMIIGTIEAWRQSLHWIGEWIVRWRWSITKTLSKLRYNKMNNTPKKASFFPISYRSFNYVLANYNFFYARAQHKKYFFSKKKKSLLESISF